MYQKNIQKKKKKEKEINKVSKIYINNFLTNPDKQFFYINKDIDTFAQYDGKDYTTITEDDLWFYILTDIPKKHYILKDVKQNIKNILIEEIKKRSIFSTIPESSTVQNIINFFCPIIIKTKEETKYFFSIIGDIILNKFTSFEDEKIFFISQKCRTFLENVNHLFNYFFNKTFSWRKWFKFIYKNQDPSKCIVLYLTKHIENKSYWSSFVKYNFLNFIVVCCHYSNRYKNSGLFFNTIKSNNIKNKLLYITKNTKEAMIKKFVTTSFEHSIKGKSHIDDLLFMWEKYKSNKNLPDIIFKTDIIKFIKNKYEIENNYILNIYNNGIATNNAFKLFWNNKINNEVNDELEISEFYRLLLQFIEGHQINIDSIEEYNVIELISYFYPNIEITNNKIIKKISCNLWDKKKSILEAINNKFNKHINNDILIYDAYIMYCKYINKENKGLIVSKEYFFKYIDKILPEKYIENKTIKLNYWNEFNTS